jgi:hypothetical protein
MSICRSAIPAPELAASGSPASAARHSIARFRNGRRTRLQLVSKTLVTGTPAERDSGDPGLRR